MKDYNAFIIEHKLNSEEVDIQYIVDIITTDMVGGLEGKPGALRMIPTYIEADNEFLTDMPVVAIDAGGTNFRAAIVKFNSQGKLEISNLVNARMPGIDGEISKETFFKTIAGYVRPLAEKSERIGFCFSYPSEILPNKDGKLLQFCKEVQAPGVIGQLIGKSLLETLGMADKQIVLLNDTVATLLAGKSASFGKEYDSFIGYILGTGTNTCYIESNRNIVKKNGLDPAKSQIINIESGAFNKPPRTDLDIAFDQNTVNPGDYSFEKMISGGYIGGLCLSTLKIASRENVFSSETSAHLATLNELSTGEVSSYISKDVTGRGPLGSCILAGEDEEAAVAIIESIINRAAKMVTANLAAVVLKTNKGKSANRPILITIEGTAFYKLHLLKPLFEKYFAEYLSGEKKRYYEFAQVPQSSLVGAALAALIN